MRQSAATIVICLLLVLLMAGCGKSDEPTVDPEEMYEQIETGMSEKVVHASMEWLDPFSETDSVAETALGQITMKTTSWQNGKQLITVIFQDGKLQSKNFGKS